VVNYLENGIAKQAYTEVPSSPLYLTSANHLNEEIDRRINVREFGHQRSDDFSTMTSSIESRAGVLEDNTTTLNTFSGRMDAIVSGYLTTTTAANNHITIQFVGTGLDALINTDATTRAYDVYVDGTLMGTSTKTASSGAEVRKIVSGLPLCSHVVKFVNTSGVSDGYGIADFIIYKPKKPTIPSGAFEQSDYGVPANYVVNATTSFKGFVASQGVIRKTTTREIITTTNGTTFSLGIPSDAGSSLPNLSLQMNAAGTGVIEYYFLGTGIELRSYVDVNSRVTQVTIDGATNFTVANNSPTFGAGWSVVPVVTHNTSTTDTFNASTGQHNGTGGASSFSVSTAISGLNYGWHKVSWARVSGTGGINLWALDIIGCPIYYNNTKSPSSLKDLRTDPPALNLGMSKVDLSKAKGLLMFDMVNQKILYSVNVSQVLLSATGFPMVYWIKRFKSSSYVAIPGQDAQVNNESTIKVNGIYADRVQLLYTNSAGSGANGIIYLVAFGELEGEDE
jgi:hypothetical protein